MIQKQIKDLINKNKDRIPPDLYLQLQNITLQNKIEKNNEAIAGTKKIRVQLKTEDKNEATLSTTIKDKNLTNAMNKIKFLFESLEKVEESAEIKVYK